MGDLYQPSFDSPTLDETRSKRCYRGVGRALVLTTGLISAYYPSDTHGAIDPHQRTVAYGSQHCQTMRVEGMYAISPRTQLNDIEVGLFTKKVHLCVGGKGANTVRVFDMYDGNTITKKRSCARTDPIYWGPDWSCVVDGSENRRDCAWEMMDYLNAKVAGSGNSVGDHQRNILSTKLSDYVSRLALGDTSNFPMSGNFDGPTAPGAYTAKITVHRRIAPYDLQNDGKYTGYLCAWSFYNY